MFGSTSLALTFSPLRKGSYHFGLYLVGFGLNIVIIDLFAREFLAYRRSVYPPPHGLSASTLAIRTANFRLGSIIRAFEDLIQAITVSQR